MLLLEYVAIKGVRLLSCTSKAEVKATSTDEGDTIIGLKI